MARSDELSLEIAQISDTALQPFLQQEFDPATFLNSALPALSTSSYTADRSTYTNTASLADISVQAQSLLSKLNSQTTRLSNSLTQVVDEIVRSGGRLAYEVELLRGEAIGLSETLNNGLKEEFAIFVPKQIEAEVGAEDGDKNDEDVLAEVPVQNTNQAQQPRYLSKLQTLTTVRDRLDAVIRLFDEAMKWPMAPAATSVLSASLISVSAPAHADEAAELSAKAKEYIDDLRKELNATLSSGSDGGTLALRRIGRLSAVAEIWNGTAEEKQRSQVVEEMQKLVIEQYKGSTGTTAPANRAAMDYRYGGTETKVEGGYGFLSNLRNLKSEAYQD